jgi:prepilin-type N-terminal cleavage/methylation domain-containing protein
MKTSAERGRGEAGFSLMELMIAMAVTVVVMGIAAHLLASGVNIRAREERRSDALADVRRALSTMSREIGNAGYGLPAGLTGNGIVAADSDSDQIRIISNADQFVDGGESPDTVSSADEDIVYRFVDDPATDQSYIMRFDVNTVISGSTVLANRIDSLVIRYFDERVTYTAGACDVGIDMATVTNSAGAAEAEVTPDEAKYVVIAACVSLPPVGTPGSPGYQAGSRTQLITDVALRNADASVY